MDKIVYQLTTEDFQNVAMEVLGRTLNADELQKTADWVADRMPWYDLINNSILDAYQR